MLEAKSWASAVSRVSITAKPAESESTSRRASARNSASMWRFSAEVNSE